MELTNVKRRGTEKKELLIFLLISFGLPCLMTIPLVIMNRAGRDTSIFAITQMFYPAAGLILANFICEKEKGSMPKLFFGGFLLLTLLLILYVVMAPFLSDESVITGWNWVVVVGSAILALVYFLAREEKQEDYGLKSKNWKLSSILILLFIVLSSAKILLPCLLIGEGAVILESLKLENFAGVWFLPIAFITSFTLFFGEEYGWRYYFQPLLQKKFGLIKGVIVFGILWGLWHLPLDLFYYPPALGFDYAAITVIQILLIRQVSCITIGIFFAYAYMKTNNLWLPVLLHFITNNMGVLLLGMQEGDATYSWGIVAAISLVHCAIFLPFLFSKVFKKQGEPIGESMQL